MDDTLSTEIERQFLVQDLLTEALDAAWQSILERELYRQVQQCVVEQCLAASMAAIDMAHVNREPEPADPATTSSWQPNQQPAPCLPDTWMRGVVQVRQLLPERTGTETMLSKSPTRLFGGRGGTLHPQGSKLLSQDSVASSSASSRTGAGRRESAGSRRQSSSGASAAAAQSTAATTPGRAPNRAAGGKPLTKRGSTQEVEDRLREEIDIRRKQLAKHAEMAARDEEERQRLDTLQKQLRGKEYGYDHRGQVVVMSSLDAETLPSTATAPTVSMQAAADPKGRPQKAKDVQQQLAAAQLPIPGQQQAASGQMAVAGQQQGSLQQGGQLAMAGAEGTKPVGKQRTGGALVDGPDYVEDKKETQPPVMDTIKLTNGCTLRAGQAVQQGPRRLATGDHMTKRDLARHIAKAAARDASPTPQPNQSAANAARSSRPGSRHGRPASSALRSSKQQRPAMHSAAPQQQQKDPSPAAAVGGEGAGTVAAEAAVTTAAPAQMPAQARPVRGGVRPRGRQQEAAADPKKPPTPDANLSILSSSDWGASPALARKAAPAVLPKNRDEYLSADSRVFNSRDRTIPKISKVSLPVAPGLRKAVATPHVDDFGGSFGR